MDVEKNEKTALNSVLENKMAVWRREMASLAKIHMAEADSARVSDHGRFKVERSSTSFPTGSESIRATPATVPGNPGKSQP